jgi:tetratricopeptide (TPR) repeat protein
MRVISRFGGLLGLLWLGLVPTITGWALDASSVYKEANAVYLQKDYKRALTLYRAAAQLSPTWAYPLVGEANCLLVLGRKQEALKPLKTAMSLAPGDLALASRVAALEASLAGVNLTAGPPPLETAGPPPLGTAGPPPLETAGLPPLEIAGPPPLEIAGPPHLEAAKPRSSSGATWYGSALRSAVCPGWGQFHNGQNTKGWLLGTATIGAFAGVGITYYLGTKAVDDYRAATTPEAAVESYNSAYGYYVSNQVFYVIFGFAYVYQILDAALNAGAPTNVGALPGEIQLALTPNQVFMSKEWKW